MFAAWTHWISLVQQHRLFAHIAGTVALLAALLLIRLIAYKILQRSEALSEPSRLHLHMVFRNIVLGLFVLGCTLIWANELRDLALSLVAIAVALVLSTKELILCFLGSLLRASGNSFSIGDRIEIRGLRGDVVDHRLFTTTILEIGPGHQRTGRSFVIPNSLFLTDTVINETFTKAYVLHVITFTVRREHNWKQAERLLLEAAREVCNEFLEDAARYMGATARKHGLLPPSVVPRVMLQVIDPDHINLLLRVPTPARDKGRVEQRILRCYFDSHHKTQDLLTAPKRN